MQYWIISCRIRSHPFDVPLAKKVHEKNSARGAERGMVCVNPIENVYLDATTPHS